MLKQTFFILKTQLHDGEAAPVEGTSISTLPNGSAAPEASPVTLFGLPKPGDPDYVAPGEAPIATADPAADRTAEYAKVKDTFKDLYEADVKSHLDRRLKGKEKQTAELLNVVEPLRQFFGMKDMPAFLEFIKNDIIPGIDGGFQQDSTVANSHFKDEGEPQSGSEVQELSAADLAGQGQALGEQLKAQGIEFDLKTELDIPEISAYLKKGLNLEQAYVLHHHKDILLHETQKTAAAQRKATIDEIRAKGINQVIEHATQPNQAVRRVTDPRQFTPKQMEEILQKVRRGEEIRL